MGAMKKPSLIISIAEGELYKRLIHNRDSELFLHLPDYIQLVFSALAGTPKSSNST